MATISLDCPHCYTAKSGFTLINCYLMADKCWATFGSCNSCNQPVTFIIESFNGFRPIDVPHNVLESGNGLQLKEIFPKKRVIEVPDHIPDNVARSFQQATHSKNHKQFDAASAMYRRTMEQALKTFAPEIEAWKIEKRIDKLHSEGKITEAMKDWAHTLRLDGNNSIHEDDASEQTVDQMHSFCHFLLTYLYTLPKQVEIARERRASAE